MVSNCITLFTQAEDGKDFYQMPLHYFDHLLQENRTGRAVCENPEIPQNTQSIPVTCETKHITVMLPIEAQLQKVRELGKNQKFYWLLLSWANKMAVWTNLTVAR